MEITAQDRHYTLLIRLPFAREGFVDPPQVEWDANKDRELWEILSRSSAKGQDLDWPDLAEKFHVNLAFLSQQAAWLYEKQLHQVRAQLRKANQPSPANASPTGGSISGAAAIVGGQPMSRGGSNGSRTTSALSQRPRERTLSHDESGLPERRALRGSIVSRKSSANTVMPTSPNAQAPQSPPEGPVSQRYRRASRESSKRSVESSPRFGKPAMERMTTTQVIDSSSSDSERDAPTSRSRTFARRPRYAAAKTTLNALSDADEEEDTPPFLPFATKDGASPSDVESRAPVQKDSQPTAAAPDRSSKTEKHAGAPKPADSPPSSSDASHTKQPGSSSPTRPSTLSPKHRRLMKEAGSDGTPSMGSSFSDLDDTSVTRSALEEAMAAEVQAGGMASRMSSISHALRSKYL